MSEKPTHVYMAKLPCGCWDGGVVDRKDRHTAIDLGEFIEDGCTIHRVTIEDARDKKRYPFGCQCGQNR